MTIGNLLHPERRIARVVQTHIICESSKRWWRSEEKEDWARKMQRLLRRACHATKPRA